MSEKLEEIGAYAAAAIVTVAIAVIFTGVIIYMATYEKTIILHSDTDDYACTVSPLSHDPTSCKLIEGTK